MFHSHRMSLSIVYGSVALMNFSLGMILPILPLYIRIHGASTFTVGLAISALSLGKLLFQGVGGYLCDRFQDQRIASLGMALYIPSMLAMTLLPVPVLFILLQFCVGIGEGILSPALYSIVATRSPRARIGTYLGLFSAFASGGLAAGPLLGGVIADRWGAQILFLLAAIMAAILVLPLLNIPGRSMQPRQQGEMQRTRSASSRRLFGLSSQVLSLLPTGIFSFLTNFAFALLQVSLPLYLVNTFHAGNSLLGLLFTLNFLIYSCGQPLLGYVSDRLKVGLDLLIAGSLAGAMFLLLPFVSNAVQFSLAFIVEALAASWITVGVRRFIGTQVETEHVGKIFGSMGAISDAGAFVGPLVAGTTYQLTAVVPFLLTGGGFGLGTLCSVIFLVRQPRARRSEAGLRQEGEELLQEGG